MSHYVTLSHKRVDNYARRLESQNLRKHGRSPTFVSIMSGLSLCYEDRGDYGLYVPDWKERMKAKAMVSS